MKITIISIGQNEPDWVKKGFDFYASRLPSYIDCKLFDIPLENCKKRTSSIIQKENQKILKYVSNDTYIIALDRKGNGKNTHDFQNLLFQNTLNNKKISFLIGGPEGLDKATLQNANEIWSLSKLTFPHMLTRIILIEQIYRVYCQNTCHPYSK